MPATARALPPAPESAPRNAPGGARASGSRRAANPDDAEENPRRRRRRGRRRNPERNPAGAGSTLGLIVIGAAALTVGYFGTREIRRRYRSKMLATSVDAALSMGATLEAAKDVVADVQQPIALTIEPVPGNPGYALVPEITVYAPGTLSASSPVSLKNVEFGSDAGGGENDLAYAGRMLDGTEFNGVAPPTSDKAIAALVTNVTPDFASKVYNELRTAMSGGKIDWNDGPTRDKTISAVLRNVVPSVDWSKGLAPFVRNDKPSTLWYAVQTLGALADQTYWNKRLIEQGG